MSSFLKTYRNPKESKLKSRILRKKITGKRLIKLIGVHNGLSARIGQNAGFDALWASSFEISTTFGMPDASLISMDKYVDIVRDINNAVDIPVIVDCDSGFGGIANTIKMAYDLELAGIAGMCIEDNLFPKQCSLYENARILAPIAEFSNRIRAVKRILGKSSFVLVARTEALVAHEGMAVALERATAYEAAGADAILIHSKAKDAAEVIEFSKKWQGRTPLVCVPTTYNYITAEKLYVNGFQVVIFANYAVRSSIFAMQKSLRTILKAGESSVVDKEIASLDEVFNLVEEPILSDLFS